MLAITSDNLSQEDDDKFAQTERKIDYLNGRLTKFIVEMSGERISSINEKELASYYHVLSDIERVGDYAENVIEYSKEIK
ncbi:MAG: PhoU domain-containing protein, partial [Clostridia bacterium]